MKAGSLFAGIGGFDLGFERAGIKTAWQVEKDEFCQKVLTKHWPDVPKYGDIYDFIEAIKRKEVEHVDIVAGGFPCQPFSQAGKRKGAQDDRYLWPAMVEVISLLRPTWVVGENVAGILNMGFENMLSELEGEGYRTETLIIPACAVNAPHRRDRVWIVAYSEDSNANGNTREFSQSNEQQEKERQKEWDAKPCGTGIHAPHPGRVRPQEQEQQAAGGKQCDCHASNAKSPEQKQPGDTRARGDGLADETFHAPDTESQRKRPRVQRDGFKLEGSEQGRNTKQCCKKNAPDTINTRLQGSERARTHEERQTAHGPAAQCNNTWDEPWIEAAARLCAVDDGVSGGLVRPKGWRVNALKAAGNAVVPQIPYIIGKTIKGISNGLHRNT